MFLIWFFTSTQQSFSYAGRVFLGWTSTKLARINVSCSRTQHSDAGEARTRGPSVSSQALYHWATALPRRSKEKVYAQRPFHNCLTWALGSVELKIDLVTTVNKIPHPLTPLSQHTTKRERHKIKFRIIHKKTHTKIRKLKQKLLTKFFAC